MTALKYLVSFAVALAIAGVLAWNSYIGRECGGPLPGFSYVLMQVVVVATAAALCVAAAILFMLPRRRAAATVLLAIGAGLIAGWWIGSQLATGNDPCPIEPAPTSREGAASFVVRLEHPYDLALTGTGTCYVSLTDGRAVGSVDGSGNSHDGWEVTLSGLPVEEPDERPFDSFDLEFFDGERGWGYRPTSWAQVQVERMDDQGGTTRLVGLPLYARRDDSAAAEAIDGRIDWQCDGQAAMGLRHGVAFSDVIVYLGQPSERLSDIH